MSKPEKPSPDFPLYAHSSKKWAKTIRRKTHYFGPWDDPQGSLALYERYADDLHSGRITEVPKNHGNTVSAPAQARLKQKPEKPHPRLPSLPASERQWMKVIRGRNYYFGPWNDPQGALEYYLRVKDDLLAGREPRPEGDGLTVKILANRFLGSKRHRVETDELSEQAFHDYKVAAGELLNAFGPNTPVSVLRPGDFARLRTHLSKSRGPVTLKNWIIRIRSIFKFAHDERLIPEPMHYGQSFSIPSAKTLRKARNAKPPRLFEADQLRQVLNRFDRKVSRNLRAMTLLGINCGFGITDCALLTFDRLDLDRGWHDFPRPKTGVLRAASLWPETVEALRQAIEMRREPVNPEDANKVFISRKGNCYIGKKLNDKNGVSQRFGENLKAMGIKREGLNFGALRHTLQTVGEGARDKVALQYMMGHAPDSKDMSAVYREAVFEERVVAVSNYVRKWLFDSGKKSV